jgi:hypothetical protein
MATRLPFTRLAHYSHANLVRQVTFFAKMAFCKNGILQMSASLASFCKTYSPKYTQAQMIRLSFYAQKTYFKCIKQSSLHLPNVPKCAKLAFTWIPIFFILAKLDSREYLFFSTCLPNLTCTSTYFLHTPQTWLARVTTSTRNAP